MKSKKLLPSIFLTLTAWLGYAQAEAPQFTLAVSEYPSWSGTFLTAWDIGLIDGDAGKQGPIEMKWDVDIVIKDTDYDSCITLFVNGNVDAACLTNIDSLPPSVTRKAVAILPTSTSAGADACLAQPDIENVQALKNVKVRGLSASVSEYTFDKGLEALGEDPSEYQFENLDPVQVGVVLQSGGIEAGVTWNPVVMETLKANSELKRLFDSSLIKGHIIDMVTASQESMAKPGGDAFGYALCEVYYTICRLMDTPATHETILTAMGKRFANLGLEDMQVIVKETEFFATPAAGIELFESQALATVMTDEIIPWSVSKGLLEQDKLPTIAQGSDETANLIFDSRYIEKIEKEQ